MDLVEDPNTIIKAFEGRAYSLNLGYFGVICRNQKQTNSGASIQTALQLERDYFNKDLTF
jgi:hypothetical protein